MCWKSGSGGDDGDDVMMEGGQMSLFGLYFLVFEELIRFWICVFAFLVYVFFLYNKF